MLLYQSLILMNNNSQFLSALSDCQTDINQQMSLWLNRSNSQTRLVQTMQHGSLLGGKRIRPYLVYATGMLFGADKEMLHTPAAAIEFMHAYSLIHDDLPQMDNDDLRRGQPTCHIKFDPASAILAGDALQCLAFEVLANGELSPKAEPLRIKMIQSLGRAAGSEGMCIGQALDLEAESQQVSIEELEEIHQHKTGAIIRCAVKLGALAAGVEENKILEALDTYARAIGLAFQVQDDILDVTVDTETLGKPSGSDLIAHKSTYPALLGLEKAKQKAQELYKEAIAALESIPQSTQSLELFARFIIERQN